MNNWVQRGKLIWEMMFTVCQGTEMHVCRVCVRICVHLHSHKGKVQWSPALPPSWFSWVCYQYLQVLCCLWSDSMYWHRVLTLNILEQMGKGPTSATERFYHSVQVRLKYSVSWLKCHLIWQLMFQPRLCVPSLFWIPCLSFLDASQQIKMHYLQIFCPC